MSRNRVRRSEYAPQSICTFIKSLHNTVWRRNQNTFPKSILAKDTATQSRAETESVDQNALQKCLTFFLQRHRLQQEQIQKIRLRSRSVCPSYIKFLNIDQEKERNQNITMNTRTVSVHKLTDIHITVRSRNVTRRFEYDQEASVHVLVREIDRCSDGSI